MCKRLVFSNILNNTELICLFSDNKFVLVGRVFTNGSGDRGSVPGHVILKTLKMVLDTSLLNTLQYKVRIKGKAVQSKERSSVLLV